MSEELDNPRILKRLAWSLLSALLAAAVGAALAMAGHPLVISLQVKFFTDWGAFLWIELGALIFCRDRIHVDLDEISALAASSWKSR
jgi:hypothetical protein